MVTRRLWVEDEQLDNMTRTVELRSRGLGVKVKVPQARTM